MDRTIRIQLKPTHEQKQLLDETTRQFTQVFNAVCAYGWQHSEKNGVRLHHATYYDLREAYPRLNANVLIQARIKATEALKSAFDRKAKGRKAGQPQSRQCPIRYNERTSVLNWQTQEVCLSTVEGRILVPFQVPPYSSKYAGYQVTTADLCIRNERYWLHVVVSVPEPDVPQSDEVIGVDLGLNRPAVTSNRHFLGSRHWKEVERRRFRLRRKLQSKGTKSAKRHLKKLSGRSLRFHRDCDHVLSKRIVEHATPGSTLVIENLTHIRSTSKIRKKTETSRRLHSWSFAQFHTFLSYKAQERGMQVVKIDPRHTSQTCSQCGHQARNNRRSQSVFHCRSCGYQLNADLNAAYNIRDKFCLAQGGTSVLSGPLSDGLSSHASV
ncbi:RNA-guided endonuclease InsQ/TnpB family protein [Ktedonobacter robiniae]|uniref:RNA-guided endonuclease InsQ/TnpB family protein n=1 Tax=Ktedonobacter robiniae TaxID=2778365 RepID=UPI001915B4EB|nr:RNA-guided endonuclease TnpB family protein [Ktedonobacter robiniae]